MCVLRVRIFPRSVNDLYYLLLCTYEISTAYVCGACIIAHKRELCNSVWTT